MAIETRGHLVAKANIGDPAPLETFDTLFNALQPNQYKWFVTYTFKNAVCCDGDVTTINRLVKRLILNRFYSRRTNQSDLKFLFVNEQHRIRSQWKRRYHVHLLLTEPIETKTNKKIIRPSVIGKPIKRTISRELRKINLIGNLHTKEINNQNDLIAYTLKNLKKDETHLLVDYMNSDFDFTKEK